MKSGKRTKARPKKKKQDTSKELRIATDIFEDPFIMFRIFWPHMRFYDKQEEIIHSVRDNDETYCPAANAMGKDFVSGFIALWFYLSRTPARVVTTSVDQSQLKGVLWGEMRRFIQEAKYPLPIQVNDLLIRQLKPDGSLEPRSELIGRVAQKGEGLLGRHLERDKIDYDVLDNIGKDKLAEDELRIKDYELFGKEQHSDGKPRCLVIFDEASGMEDTHYDSTDTWAHRKLVIGNPYPCENFFKKGTEEGDQKAPEHDLTKEGTERFYRKVIHIPATFSPNVRLALAEEELDKKVSHRIIVPGVMTYRTYLKRRATWTPMKQSIGLDAEFYEGEEVKMYPKDWIRTACELYPLTFRTIRNRGVYRRCIGVDPAEGGDDTVWTVGDDYGILKQISEKTPDTSVIPGRTVALLREYNVKPQDVYFDRGGGGKQHADALRKQGYAVRSVGFGESAADESTQYKKFAKTSKGSKEEQEERYVFKNRRAQMYWMLREAIGPAPKIETKDNTWEEDENHIRFSIPRDLEELIRQMSKIPLLYDGEGRIYLPPKSKPNENYTGTTIIDMLGCSPDELDSLVLCIYGLKSKKLNVVAG